MKKFTLGHSKEEVFQLVPERVIKKVILGETSIAIVRIGEYFHSFQAFCPHRGASLIQGTINSSGEIICPLHQYRFDLETGQVKSGYCDDLAIFPNELTDNGLEITIP
jgi:nitrite reductase/ring-hydroxylating ferredoxin subunit